MFSEIKAELEKAEKEIQMEDYGNLSIGVKRLHSIITKLTVIFEDIVNKPQETEKKPEDPA
jgi:arsenate reductase-like glutaredoxin family protein